MALTTGSDRGAGSGGRGCNRGSVRRVSSHSAAETERVAAGLGALLAGGECVLLSGELGAGKTTFIRGLARGLGVEDPAGVHSPSYTLVNRYPGRIPLLHVDAYFMHSAEDLDLCGFEDALGRGDVVVVEWADRIAAVLEAATGRPSAWIKIAMEHTGETDREITVVNWPADSTSSS
jgi:tRNA threonylcarbamoyladenosine biosynthesis protein TsaE